MKKYSDELINEAKVLYTTKNLGALRIQRELIKHKEAEGLQVSTVSLWIKKFKWKDSRKAIAKRTEEKFINRASEENVKELNLIDSGISYILTDMKNKKVKSNLSNLAELIKLRMIKRGEVTEVSEVRGSVIDRLHKYYEKSKKSE